MNLKKTEKMENSKEKKEMLKAQGHYLVELMGLAIAVDINSMAQKSIPLMILMSDTAHEALKMGMLDNKFMENIYKTFVDKIRNDWNENADSMAKTVVEIFPDKFNEDVEREARNFTKALGVEILKFATEAGICKV